MHGWFGGLLASGRGVIRSGLPYLVCNTNGLNWGDDPKKDGSFVYHINENDLYVLYKLAIESYDLRPVTKDRIIESTWRESHSTGLIRNNSKTWKSSRRLLQIMKCALKILLGFVLTHIIIDKASGLTKPCNSFPSRPSMLSSITWYKNRYSNFGI